MTPHLKLVEERRRMTRLKQELQRQGKSAYSLAKDLGVIPNTVYNWTNGQNLPRSQHMKQISEILGVPVGELFFSDTGGGNHGS
jgi:transcriptional regulator with XRE-family HTH domain